ncbi:MAG: hypothetical protein LLF76_00355 [Planctomycetaceae bacterium]|nr:hypothetical protein [Planctomycetaceae bacterium]
MPYFELNITTEEASRCAKLLRDARGPLTAADLAARLHLGGERESRRRRVREIVTGLRHEYGMRIVGFNPGGYWLVKTEAEWLEYCRDRENYAKRIIGEAAQRIRIVTDNKGQGLLFVK